MCLPDHFEEPLSFLVERPRRAVGYGKFVWYRDVVEMRSEGGYGTEATALDQGDAGSSSVCNDFDNIDIDLKHREMIPLRNFKP
jgi:hypothetical protein